MKKIWGIWDFKSQNTFFVRCKRALSLKGSYPILFCKVLTDLNPAVLLQINSYSETTSCLCISGAYIHVCSFICAAVGLLCGCNVWKGICFTSSLVLLQGTQHSLPWSDSLSCRGLSYGQQIPISSFSERTFPRNDTITRPILGSWSTEASLAGLTMVRVGWRHTVGITLCHSLSLR